MDFRKKSIQLTGTVRLPLLPGHRAFIDTNEGTFDTSPVVSISWVDDTCAVFETRNTNYYVSSVPEGDLMSLRPMAMAACA